MFRKMRRSKQALTEDECARLLNTETRGVLSMIGDDGYPYGIPINHYYSREDNALYFHGCKIGHRVDAIKNEPKVSYCVYGSDAKADDSWSYYVDSVVIFGKAYPVEDYDEMIRISKAISARFPVPEGYVEGEIQKDGPATLCIKVDIEHMTGKRVHES